MDDMSAFDRQLAAGVRQLAGPGRDIDPVAMARAVATPSPKWRLQPMFSATKVVVASVIVALFAALVIVGLPGTGPEQAEPAIIAPASESYLLPSEIPDGLESGVLETPIGPARWVRVTGSPANPSLMAAVATEDGFAVLDHWSNRLWKSSDLLSWTELTMPSTAGEAESDTLLGSAGSYWLTARSNDDLILWRSDDLVDWDPVDIGGLSPAGAAGLFLPRWLGQPVEIDGKTLVPVEYFWGDLTAYLGLPAEPGGEQYVSGGYGGSVFEPIEPGVYRVLTTASDIDAMPTIRLEEAAEGTRVTDAVDGTTLRELQGMDRESVEALLAAFAEEVDGRKQDQRRWAQLDEWAIDRGIARSQLAILDGGRLEPLEATGHPDANLILLEAGEDAVLLEFRGDGSVGVRRSSDGIQWTPSVLATDAAGDTFEADRWSVGTDDIEVVDTRGRVLRSSDGTDWQESNQPSELMPVEADGFADFLVGPRLGGMVASLAVDDGVAETLRLYTAEAERIDIDLRPLEIRALSDDGEDEGFGRIISDTSVALGFGSPPRRGAGDYWIISFDELTE